MNEDVTEVRDALTLDTQIVEARWELNRALEAQAKAEARVANAADVLEALIELRAKAK